MLTSEQPLAREWQPTRLRVRCCLHRAGSHPSECQKARWRNYRLGLQRLVQKEGVEGKVVFHNRFVSLLFRRRTGTLRSYWPMGEEDWLPLVTPKLLQPR